MTSFFSAFGEDSKGAAKWVHLILEAQISVTAFLARDPKIPWKSWFKGFGRATTPTDHPKTYHSLNPQNEGKSFTVLFTSNKCSLEHSITAQSHFLFSYSGKGKLCQKTHKTTARRTLHQITPCQFLLS